MNLQMYDKAYYERSGLIESAFQEAGLLRPEQASAVAYAYAKGRRPFTILSIGSGIGILEKFLERLEIRLLIIGTDPSPDAAQIYQGSLFYPMGFVEAVTEIKCYDTVIMCAVLEHIPQGDIEAGIEEISNRTCRLIITNRLEYHPIRPNGWDHITKIDDDLFQVIANKGSIVFHHGSHLVVDYPKDGVQ